MNKKICAILVIVIFSIVVVLLPDEGTLKSKDIIHQHRVEPGHSESTVGFDEHGNLTSHLPLMIIDTKGHEIPGINRMDTDKLICDYKIIDNVNGINYSEDTTNQKGQLEISVRGNSSRRYEKKQYGIKLVDSNGLSVDRSLLGMPKESTWVLNGSHIDKSQLRNYILYNISGEIMAYAPQSRLCEVLFMDASGAKHYQGIYTLIEKPKVSINRLNLTKYEKKHKESSFVLNINTPIEGIKITHLKPDSLDVYPCELIYPNENDVTEETVDYIQDKLLKAEKVLYDGNYMGKWDKISNYYNLDSFVDYYIINEFFQNYDAGRRSTYLYCDLGGKLSIGPVWDFDGAFNNYSNMSFKIDLLDLKSSYYYCYLADCPEFIEMLENRYKDLRKTFLSDEHLLEYIDESYEYAQKAICRNCDRWYESQYDVVDQDVQFMKKFVKERGQWMDANFIASHQNFD